MPAVPITSSEQYEKALEVLDRVGGTFQGVGFKERFLLVTEAQYKALVEANPVDAPKSLVDQQKVALIEDFKGRLKKQGLGEGDFSEYKKKWDKDFEDSATFMVKSTFLLDSLAETLQLRARPAEIDEKISEYAKSTGIEMDRLNEFYSKPERRSRLAFQVTEEKVVNYLLSKAKITEVAKEKLPKDPEP